MEYDVNDDERDSDEPICVDCACSPSAPCLLGGKSCWIFFPVETSQPDQCGLCAMKAERQRDAIRWRQMQEKRRACNVA